MTYREEQLILNRIEALEQKLDVQDKILNKIYITLNLAKIGNFPINIEEIHE